MSLGAAVIKIAFAFHGVRFFLHSCTSPPSLFAFISAPPSFVLKRAALVLLSFLAAAYQVHCLNLLTAMCVSRAWN